jgi:D-lyxose ketol-isomerase
MISRKQYEKVRRATLLSLKQAGLIVTASERARVEVADFGLGRLEEFGLQIITYVNTERCCAKELVLLPRQICPEHRHPSIARKPGKEETFRCRQGIVYLYIPGKPAAKPAGRVPKDRRAYFTAWKEIKLKPGEQYTLAPDTLHWFQAGPKGAVVSEFSTRSVDEADIFTDPAIKRAPVVK